MTYQLISLLLYMEHMKIIQVHETGLLHLGGDKLAAKLDRGQQQGQITSSFRNILSYHIKGYYYVCLPLPSDTSCQHMTYLLLSKHPTRQGNEISTTTDCDFVKLGFWHYGQDCMLCVKSVGKREKKTKMIMRWANLRFFIVSKQA